MKELNIDINNIHQLDSLSQKCEIFKHALQYVKDTAKRTTELLF